MSYNIEINSKQASYIYSFLKEYLIPQEELNIEYIEKYYRGEPLNEYKMAFDTNLTCEEYLDDCRENLKDLKDLRDKVEKYL